MRKLVEKNVKAAVRECLDDEGLDFTCVRSYGDLEYNLDDIFLPMLNDDDPDSRYDQLESECVELSRACFTHLLSELKRAQFIINAVLSMDGL
ncbi:MAG: hypothetical protein V1844_09780 [Pseudomonadota bacterium]